MWGTLYQGRDDWPGAGNRVRVGRLSEVRSRDETQFVHLPGHPGQCGARDVSAEWTGCVRETAADSGRAVFPRPWPELGRLRRPRGSVSGKGLAFPLRVLLCRPCSCSTGTFGALSVVTGTASPDFFFKFLSSRLDRTITFLPAWLLLKEM